MMKPFCLCKNRKLSIYRENTSPHKSNQANQPTQQPNRISSLGGLQRSSRWHCVGTHGQSAHAVCLEPRLWWTFRWILLETPQSYYPLDFELIFSCCTFRNFLHTFFVTPTLSQATPTTNHATPRGVHNPQCEKLELPCLLCEPSSLFCA